MRRDVLAPDEVRTIWKTHSRSVMITAHGLAQTKEKAIVKLSDLDTFVTGMFLGTTPAVLSLIVLCEDRDFSHERQSGEPPLLSKDEKAFWGQSDKRVHVVADNAPGDR